MAETQTENFHRIDVGFKGLNEASLLPAIDAITVFEETAAMSPVAARVKCLQLVDGMITMFNLNDFLVPEAKKIITPACESTLKEFVPDNLSQLEAVRNARIVYQALVKWAVRYIFEWQYDHWPEWLLTQFDHSVVPSLMRAGIEDRLEFTEWLRSFFPKFLELASLMDAKFQQRFSVPGHPLLLLLVDALTKENFHKRSKYSEESQKKDAKAFTAAVGEHITQIIASTEQEPAARLAIDKLDALEYRLRRLQIDEEQIRNDPTALGDDKIKMLQMLASDRQKLEQQINTLKQQLELA